MKSLKKLGILSASVLALTLSACGGEGSALYMRSDDDGIYEHVLGYFSDVYSEAKSESQNMNKRFVEFARAEAALMDSATFMPTTTQGGNYAMTRIAAHTVPYSLWGNDTDRLRGTVIVNNFIKSTERAEMIEAWKEARAGGDAYDPAAYLTGKGYEVKDSYLTTFSTAPETLDVLNTSMQADTESLINAVDGLIEYDNLGLVKGRVAESWSNEANEDGTETWTFNLKSGLKWYKGDGSVYQVDGVDQEVTADDFVAGFQHMLDAQAGLEYLTKGVVVGADEYIKGTITDFSKVGIEAVDDYTLAFTLCQPESFFITRLSYSCFMPMNRAYFLSQGGAFGVKEYKEAAAKDTFKYGLVSDRNSVVYNGPYHPVKIDKEEISYEKTAGYENYNASEAEITTTKLKWTYDAGDQPEALYNATLAGTYNGIGLGEASGLLAKAKADGNFAQYSYVADTNATTYFGGFNVNRGTFEVGSVKSGKTENQKTYTYRAMQNANFRHALQHSWDRVTWNAVSVGSELAANNLRNIYTAPEFVSLTEDYVYHEGLSDEHTFEQGSTYGELVAYFLQAEFGQEVNTADGVDGWYNPEAAKEYFDAFKEEIGEYVSYPIVIDVVYYGASKNQTAQAQAFKKSIEESLGSENVRVDLLAAATTDDYYAAGYRAPNGEAGCFDVFYGSGWGPDYGDPSTYLDTFQGDGAGYMTKVIGLY